MGNKKMKKYKYIVIMRDGIPLLLRNCPLPDNCELIGIFYYLADAKQAIRVIQL